MVKITLCGLFLKSISFSGIKHFLFILTDTGYVKEANLV
jgi:hypothetical protein